MPTVHIIAGSRYSLDIKISEIEPSSEGKSVPLALLTRYLTRNSSFTASSVEEAKAPPVSSCKC